MHTSKKLNHADDWSLNITHEQYLGIHRAVSAAPLQHGAAVIDRSASFSPEKVIRVTPNRQRAVKRLVLQERAEMFRQLLTISQRCVVYVPDCLTTMHFLNIMPQRQEPLMANARTLQKFFQFL